jgi:hypothetical protein
MEQVQQLQQVQQQLQQLQQQLQRQQQQQQGVQQQAEFQAVRTTYSAKDNVYCYITFPNPAQCAPEAGDWIGIVKVNNLYFIYLSFLSFIYMYMLFFN